MGILDKVSGFISRNKGFFSNGLSSLGKKLSQGVYWLGDKIFGGSGTGRKIFNDAANYLVDSALNTANYYGKKFVNSDLVQSKAKALVPELENAADYFTDHLRKGYYGTDAKAPA